MRTPLGHQGRSHAHAKPWAWHPDCSALILHLKTDDPKLIGERNRGYDITIVFDYRAIIEHPENIAFDPAGPMNGTLGADEFYVISGKLRLFGTFAAVTSVALLDRNSQAD
jgi:hypothetical protein